MSMSERTGGLSLEFPLGTEWVEKEIGEKHHKKIVMLANHLYGDRVELRF